MSKAPCSYHYSLRRKVLFQILYEQNFGSGFVLQGNIFEPSPDPPNSDNIFFVEYEVYVYSSQSAKVNNLQIMIQIYL